MFRRCPAREGHDLFSAGHQPGQNVRCGVAVEDVFDLRYQFGERCWSYLWHG
jgi:hypothetical protein